MKWSVFSCYLQACGYVFWPGIIVWCLMYIASQTSTNIWLSVWSDDKLGSNGTVDTNLRDLRLGVYGGLGAVQGMSRHWALSYSGSFWYECLAEYLPDVVCI